MAKKNKGSRSIPVNAKAEDLLKAALNPSKRVIQSPRMSLNKLAEYLMADSSKRKKLVVDAKYPDANPTPEYYGEAREGVRAFLLSGYDGAVLDDAIAHLDSKATTSSQGEARIEHNKSALEAIGDTSLPDLSAYTVSKHTGRATKLKINGVAVSVYPDVIVRGTIRKKKVVGAVMTHITKDGLTEESCKNVAVLLKDFLEAHVADSDEVVRNALCYSVDVRTKQVLSCPQGTATRKKKINDACEEIAMWWKRL